MDEAEQHVRKSVSTPLIYSNEANVLDSTDTVIVLSMWLPIMTQRFNFSKTMVLLLHAGAPVHPHGMSMVDDNVIFVHWHVERHFS